MSGKKRHLPVDTEGLLLRAIVHAADVQDRHGGVPLINTPFGLFLFLLKLYADAGIRGQSSNERWVVERIIAWLCRCRRLAKDWKCSNRTDRIFLRWASIRFMLRRLDRNAQ